MSNLEKELFRIRTIKEELILRKNQNESFQNWMEAHGQWNQNIANDTHQIDHLLEIIDRSEEDFIKAVRKAKRSGLYLIMKDMLDAGCKIS